VVAVRLRAGLEGAAITKYLAMGVADQTHN